MSSTIINEYDHVPQSRILRRLRLQRGRRQPSNLSIPQQPVLPPFLPPSQLPPSAETQRCQTPSRLGKLISPDWAHRCRMGSRLIVPGYLPLIPTLLPNSRLDGVCLPLYLAEVSDCLQLGKVTSIPALHQVLPLLAKLSEAEEKRADLEEQRSSQQTGRRATGDGKSRHHSACLTSRDGAKTAMRVGGRKEWRLKRAMSS